MIVTIHKFSNNYRSWWVVCLVLSNPNNNYYLTANRNWTVNFNDKTRFNSKRNAIRTFRSRYRKQLYKVNLIKTINIDCSIIRQDFKIATRK